MSENLKFLAREVLSDIAQFRGAALIAVAQIETGGVKQWSSLTDFIQCANNLDASAEQLAKVVLAS